MTQRTVIITVAVLALGGLVAAGCGGGGGGGDEDATDTTGSDTETDLATDTGPDTPPDTAPDTEPDTETDVEPDSETDVEPDTPMDPPEDWPTDIPGDWPVDTSSACASAGGFCTAVRWELCPPGYEPIDPDPHRDCGSSGGIAGWCCVVAPFSTCSASARGNCVVGTSCTGCWGSVPGLSCEPGRVCCEDICD